MLITRNLLISVLNILQSIQAQEKLGEGHYLATIPVAYIDDLVKQIRSHIYPERQTAASPYEIKKRLGSWQYVARAIIDGLDGKPFSWCGGEFDAYRPKAEAMGITLITQTQITKQGYRLKAKTQPVGNGYFRAPISRSADLYVLECQCVKEEGAEDDKP